MMRCTNDHVLMALYFTMSCFPFLTLYSSWKDLLLIVRVRYMYVSLLNIFFYKVHIHIYIILIHTQFPSPDLATHISTRNTNLRTSSTSGINCSINQRLRGVTPSYVFDFCDPRKQDMNGRKSEGKMEGRNDRTRWGGD